MNFFNILLISVGSIAVPCGIFQFYYKNSSSSSTKILSQEEEVEKINNDLNDLFKKITEIEKDALAISEAEMKAFGFVGDKISFHTKTDDIQKIKNELTTARDKYLSKVETIKKDWTDFTDKYHKISQNNQEEAYYYAQAEKLRMEKINDALEQEATAINDLKKQYSLEIIEKAKEMTAIAIEDIVRPIKIMPFPRAETTSSG